jgi:hypothetical protein
LGIFPALEFVLGTRVSGEQERKEDWYVTHRLEKGDIRPAAENMDQFPC